MRRVLPVVVIMLTVASLATGCDFFRALAGRPTSKDIAAKREAIRVAQQAAADSIAVADSIAAADSIEVVPESKPEAPKPSAPVAQGKKRFYVIMGAFSNRENAERCAERLNELGYKPEYFGFTEGRTAVGIGGTDDVEEAKRFMSEIKGQDFCPQGVWILDRKRK